ncbi:lysylphosphatidylglycerol synthase transmembrane domain-containing protein [Tumebacillus lipolyticus]|uniref:Phosphatidylglycerol lysyltransferase n=1 Tax=Tumebacillus lipolyticus TaxID=1280370 RepID=A0ABW4ZXX6_9BACL
MNANKLTSRIITGLMIGVVVSVLFFFWGDVREVKDVIFSISVPTYLLAIATTLASYFVRFLKWQYFLKVLKIEVPWKDSLNIHFIGLSMSITPGKVGELLKSYLLKNRAGVEMARSAPAVFADRLTDLFAMLCLVGAGVSLFAYGTLAFLIVLAGLLAITVILQSRSISLWLIDRLAKISFFQKRKDSLLTLYESTYELLRFKALSFATLLSVIAWFMECISLYVLIVNLGLDLSLLHVVFIFSLGTVAGALSMLPGGLGIAEGSMTGMFLYFGLAKGTAVSITLLIRLVTLWLGVLIGIFIFFLKRKTYMP